MNNYIPFATQSLIEYFNMQPSEVKGRFNSATDFYKRYLYMQIYSRFKFNLPKSWDLNYFRFWLFHFGSIGCVYTNEFGWVCQPYSIVELNINYNPRVIQFYNQFIKKPKLGIVGVNSAIIRCADDYFGLDDIVTRYAEMLAQCDRCVNVNLMNANVTALFEADSKKQSEEIKDAYSKATSGAPMVVVNKDVMGDKNITTLMGNVKNNYIADSVLQTKRTLINEFLTKIGINNANYDKKERMNSQEVTQNNEEVKSIISVIAENIEMGFEMLRKVSGLDVSVSLVKGVTNSAEN